jgi:hypothetical protein
MNQVGSVTPDTNPRTTSSIPTSLRSDARKLQCSRWSVICHHAVTCACLRSALCWYVFFASCQHEACITVVSCKRLTPVIPTAPKEMECLCFWARLYVRSSVSCRRTHKVTETSVPNHEQPSSCCALQVLDGARVLNVAYSPSSTLCTTFDTTYPSRAVSTTMSRTGSLCCYVRNAQARSVILQGGRDRRFWM